MMRFRLPKRGSKPDAVKAEHYARLGDNFGSPRRGRYINGDEGRSVGGDRFWLQPLTLFILSLLALVLVSGVQLWRLGWFGVWFGAKSAQIDNAPKRWQLDGRKAAPLDPAVPDDDGRGRDSGPPEFEEVDAPPVAD